MTMRIAKRPVVKGARISRVPSGTRSGAGTQGTPASGFVLPISAGIVSLKPAESVAR